MNSPPVISLMYLAIRGYSSTIHLKITNDQKWMAYHKTGGRVLFCAWHQQFFPAIRPFRDYGPYHPALMISRSRDGELIAAIARKSGWTAIRGSSSKGGAEALKGMIRHLRTHGLAAHILDGPRGPAGIVKPGVIKLAHAARAAIVPILVSVDRAWYFNSWDRFMLPKPFSRVRLNFGDPIHLEPTENRTAFESQRRMLENIMRPALSVY